MFRKNVQKDIYLFKKDYNKRGVEVNTLYNYKGRPVYRAYVTEKKPNESTYCFHDIRKKRRMSHTIGITTENEGASDYRVATFEFDGVDVWERISQLGITLRLTNLDKYNSVFRIFQNGEELGSARMKTSKNQNKTMSIQSDDNSGRMLFFIAFAISRIY